MPQNTQGSSVIEYRFSGPGIIRAVQESVDTQANLEFFRDTDQEGTIVRVGYYLISRETNEQVSPLKYFSKEEITITTLKSSEGVIGTGRLEVGFDHTKKHEKHFSVVFPIGKEEFRVRCLFRKEKDGNQNFVIMFDKKEPEKNNWKAISRFDCAHGFIHKDVIDAGGVNTLEKKKLPIQDKKRAIGFIINEILKELKIQQKLSFRRKEISKITQRNIALDIRRAEKLITKLFESKELFQRLKSNMVAFAEERNSVLSLKS